MLQGWKSTLRDSKGGSQQNLGGAEVFLLLGALPAEVQEDTREKGPRDHPDRDGRSRELHPVQPGVSITCLGLGIVFVSWAAITKYHRLVGLNNRHLSSLSTRGWKSKIKVPVGLASFEALLFGL